MQPSDYSIVSRQLEEKVIAYWHDVDFHWGEKAAAHYMPDGLFISANARYEGRQQIAEFYAWRKERGERVNVHLVGNFYLKALTEDRAEVDWICTLFANDGPAPQPSAPPIAISRVEDVFVREPGGDWLCQERRWHTLFRGEVKPTALTPEQMAARMAGKAS
jgi:hypothetical protein